MKVYKVVRNVWGERRSPFAPIGAIRIYSTARVLSRWKDYGPLAAFSSLEAARDWIESLHSQDLEVWEAEATPAAPPSDHLSLALWTPARAFPLEALPEGTVLCETITLKERIS